MYFEFRLRGKNILNKLYDTIIYFQRYWKYFSNYLCSLNGENRTSTLKFSSITPILWLFGRIPFQVYDSVVNNLKREVYFDVRIRIVHDSLTNLQRKKNRMPTIRIKPSSNNVISISSRKSYKFAIERAEALYL